jgi:hypothetical protein
MLETLELGTTTPYDEPCAQLGSEGYLNKARQEIRAFAGQLLRSTGQPPAGARLKTLHCPHDFGTYLDLALVYDADDESQVEWMLKMESNIPDKWDQTAIQELTEVGYFQTKETTA